MIEGEVFLSIRVVLVFYKPRTSDLPVPIALGHGATPRPSLEGWRDSQGFHPKIANRALAKCVPLCLDSPARWREPSHRGRRAQLRADSRRFARPRRRRRGARAQLHSGLCAAPPRSSPRDPPRAACEMPRCPWQRDAEIDARLAQAEMAYRMQSSVPEASDLSGESDETFDLYGPGARDPGTFAANCLLARRLVERGVRFVQLFHQGWDQHGGLPGGISHLCRQTDQASAALVTDLKRRGLLEDTLVIWGGEFGRTAYCQGRMTADNYGRDHHPRAFSIWMAGGGVKAGHVHGQTDDFGYSVVDGGVHVHDLHATILHLMGVDHERLTYRFQGRHYRLTDIAGAMVPGIIA